MYLSGQPALKVRLAASSKRDENEWITRDPYHGGTAGCMNG